MISKAQPPTDHPALQERKYYCDVYTGSSIVCFESYDLDSLLTIAKTFIIPAQSISLYSYIQNPYNNERIFAQALEEASNSSSLFRSSFPRYKEFEKVNYYWQPRQYYSYLPSGIPRRNRNW